MESFLKCKEPLTKIILVMKKKLFSSTLIHWKDSIEKNPTRYMMHD